MVRLRSPRMEFVYSRNEVVKEYIDPKLGKIGANGNFTAFNNNWIADVGNIQKIAQYTCAGYGLCAWHLVEGKRTRKGTGCIRAGLIIVDIDNQADHKDKDGNKVQKQELTVEEALKLDLCTKYLSFAYYSPSTSKDWPRFRLVFGLEKPIVDKDFYQWFTREINKKIPGSDVRATQVPNLFYGTSAKDGLICTTEKFIPAWQIDEAYRAYLASPQNTTEGEGEDAAELLNVATDEDGIELESLLSKTVQNILDGGEVSDRSSETAAAFKEIIGWVNWTQEHGIPLKTSPLDAANRVFYAVYQYDPELDGKFNRILGSIQDTESLQPAITLAAEDKDLAAWKRLKKVNKAIYDTYCTEETKNQIKNTKPKPKDSVLSMDFGSFDLGSDASTLSANTTTSTSTQPSQPAVTTTPQTPTQLINIQQNNRQFSENDIADIIVNNYGELFLYDSSLDEFFAYDEDDGVWFLNDEQHIKRRIVKTLDTFVQAGVLPRYNSATIGSVYLILKAKLLKSVNGGRSSIWQSARGQVPFNNGVLDTKTLQFTEGNHKNYYFQTKLRFDYDTNAACPEILKWLTWAVGADKVVLIRAFCRAVLTGYTTGERFLHLIGPGGSGKSTLQQLLIALAGYSGTHTSDLETIETNRFECHSLIGKRLLLLTDEASFSKRLDTLKKLTSSSDTLRAERKYGKEVVNFKPELLVSIASNEHISSSDISSGLERRRLTVVMDQVIDPSLRRNLISVYPDRIEGEFTAELPGFAAWLLDMPYDEMKDVLANPVKHCPDLNTSNLDALIFNNPICAFLADCCLYAPNSATVLGGGAFRPSVDESERGYYVKNAYTEVYAAYVNYCKSNGYKHSAKPRFVDRLKETVNNVVKIPGINVKYVKGKAMVTGLRLKPYDTSTDRAASGSNRLPSPIDWATDPKAWDSAFTEHDPAPTESND